MTIGDLQAQVELMVGHSQLATKVITWANRTCQDVATRAFWSRQIGVGFTAHSNVASASDSVTYYRHVFTFVSPNTNFNEFVAPYGVDQVSLSTTGTNVSITSYERPLIRLELADLYAQASGLSAAAATSATSSYYAMAYGTADTGSASMGGTVSEYFVGYPFPATTGNAQQMAVAYLGAPLVLSSGSDTNWILQRYPKVALAGVLRYVRLYLGDGVGFMLEKAEYENGIADMLKSEEAPAANAPVMRGVDAGQLGRLV